MDRASEAIAAWRWLCFIENMCAKTYRNSVMAVAGMLYLFERSISVVTKSIEEALRFQLTRTAKKWEKQPFW
jgi:hypothetical protein